jgi:hypothetical protein
MQARTQIYIESEALFRQVREHFLDASEVSDGAASFRLDGLTVHANPGEAEAGRMAGVYLDEDYERLTGRQERYSGLLWLNQSSSLAPKPMPAQDFDLMQWEELRTFAELAPRPSLEQCLDWWDDWELPENICRHVTEVAGAAYKLAVWMRQAGIDVDPILTHRAGLAHDLDKIKTLREPRRHGQVSADFISARGFPELAVIVRKHLLGIFLYEDVANLSWETKLVNFCDKLVEGDEIVSITERFSALKKRYPQSQELLDSSEPYLWRLNDDICSILALDGHEALLAKLND